MSILIKGMDMPKEGERHRITIYDNGDAYIATSNRLYETDRKDVEVVEIPTPHGRLIDADKLTDNIATTLERNNKLIDLWFANLIQDEIGDAPTIVEAEMEKARIDQYGYIPIKEE